LTNEGLVDKRSKVVRRLDNSLNRIRMRVMSTSIHIKTDTMHVYQYTHSSWACFDTEASPSSDHVEDDMAEYESIVRVW